MTTADIQTLTKDKLQLDEPPKYNVVFLNDDVTTYEFVIKVLKNIFNKTEQEAKDLTQSINQTGKGIAGTYLYEIAEQKGIETTVLARDEGFPLQVKVQKNV